MRLVDNEELREREGTGHPHTYVYIVPIRLTRPSTARHPHNRSCAVQPTRMRRLRNVVSCVWLIGRWTRDTLCIYKYQPGRKMEERCSQSGSLCHTLQLPYLLAHEHQYRPQPGHQLERGHASLTPCTMTRGRRDSLANADVLARRCTNGVRLGIISHGL